MPPNASDGNDASSNDSTYIERREFDPQSAPLISSSEPLLETAADRIASRKRKLLQHDMIRITSFLWGLFAALCAGGIATFSIYAPFFLRDLRYSQYKVNTVAIVAEVAMYLLVPIFGYLCDRYTPRPISIIAAVSFGVGYIGAAFVYKSGSTVDNEGSYQNNIGFGWMLVAFTFIGIGTCAMYLTAVTTCAKNFGKGKYKGLMLALPISAFGVSGMWQAQLGSHVLTRPVSGSAEGAKELDPAKYFLFLGILLTIVGLVGAVAFRIVDEDDLIDEAVEDLERSGLLVAYRRPSAYSRSGETAAAGAEAEYGTFGAEAERTTSKHGPASDDEEDNENSEDEREKKTWLLNYETSLFLRDETMWLLAIGFLFVTGPSEAYINNVGTIIDTLTPSDPATKLSPGLASTHVSIIALSSTVARLLVGTVSDLFAPTPAHPHPQPSSANAVPVYTRSKFTFSRMYILVPSLIILLAGYFILALPDLLSHPALLQVSTAVIGTGYGASFALVPIIITVVWGVENFGTNWGIVAMFPAAGAAFWGMVYSIVYDRALKHGNNEVGGKCIGWRCYGAWAVGSTVSVGIAIGFCGVAWWRWNKRGIIV